MKMVTAFIRTTSLERVIKALNATGIRGITISEIKGIGQQIEVFRPYTIHNRIDIIVTDEKVEEVTGKILEHASTGLAGDGHIAVFPLDYTIKIRTMEKRS